MIKLFKNLWKNIFNFRGTASRKEFFLSLLANTIGMYIIFIPFLLVYAAILLLIRETGISSSTLMTMSYVLSGIYAAVFMIPIFSLIIRRMRDSGAAWWLMILLIIVLPVLGVFIVGIMKKSERKLCMLTKIGWTFFLGGIGAVLWQIPLTYLTDEPLLENLAVYGLGIMVIGLIIGYIGTKIDDVINESNA